MDTTNFSGTWTSVAAILVFILAKFGINTQVQDVLTVISAVILIIGIVKQAIDHKKLGNAIAASHR